MRPTLHGLVPDGWYSSTDRGPDFAVAARRTAAALRAVLQRIIARILELRTRRHIRIEVRGQVRMADNYAGSDESRTLGPLQAAACICRIRICLPQRCG